MFNKHISLFASVCFLFSNNAFSQVNLLDTLQVKVSLEKFIQQKLNNEIFPENDPAKIYGVWDEEYWETDEKGAFKMHNTPMESRLYKSDTASINFQRLQMKEIHLTYEINDMHFRIIGKNMVIINYKLIQHTVFNNEPCTKLIRVTEVDEQKNKNWKTLTYNETVIPEVPLLYPHADKAAYKDYVGEYQLLTNHFYKITLIGEKLMWGRKNMIELIQEDENTFVLNGREFYRIRFERNNLGTVKSLRMIEFPGVEYTAKKVN